jgi:putative ABC transport system substrate-binding protein
MERLDVDGFLVGRALLLESRYAEGRFERLPDLAAELIHLKVDVLHATSTIPIVGVLLADPIGTGFATSFARPGGNITGLAFHNTDLSTKRLELLTEAVPGVARIAVLWDSHNPASASAVRATQEAARSLGVQLHLLAVQGPEDFASAFEAVLRRRLCGAAPLDASSRSS